MANTSSRTLRLLSLLQTHRYWPGPELAEQVEVSVRTLRRDIDRLRELGYPVHATRGVDGGYQLAPGAALPPLVLEDDEAVALVIGMQAAIDGATPGIEEAALRALTKVAQVMPARLRRRVSALRAATVAPSARAWGAEWADRPTVAPDALISVALACRDAERLEFAYTTGERGTGGRRAGTRHVEPHRLVPLGRRWYLVAYDLDRQDWRTFRLDRLSRPRSTGSRFGPRTLPAADAAAFVRAGIRDQAFRHQVVAVVQAPADAVTRRVGRWGRVEPLGGDSCRLTLSAESLDWAAFALGVVGVPFTVEGPAELVALLHDWAARFAGSTG